MPEVHPRILVVDDTEAVRYATSRILRRAGFEVEEANDGASALRAVQTAKPDIVVLDVKLPDMSGFEVCHRIKGDPVSRSIPVLHVSAMCIDSGSRVAGLDAGADAYLTHPVSDDELLATINALLRIRRAEEEALKQAEEARAVRNELQSVLAALRQKNHTLEALVQACPLAIMAIDLEGQVTAWNAAAVRMFGWSEEDIRGRRLPTIVPESLPGERVLEELAVGGEKIFECETVRQRRDGKRFPVSISAAPLYDSEGQSQGAIVVVSDETNRKVAEQAVRRHEQLVSNGRMASALAHEINNPLSAVLNVLYLLRKRNDLDSSVTEYLKVADDQLGRVSQITNQVLSVHRTTGDDIELHIAEIIDASLGLYTLHLRERQIEVKREYDYGSFAVSSPSDLRQIVSNLIGNAIEVLGVGGILAVRAREQVSSGRKGIRITVADNGPGISPEHRARIFEPFFTSKGDKGTGLGLWIVNTIVHKHHGSVRVRTSTGGIRRGTSFSVFLPNSAEPDKTHSLAERRGNTHPESLGKAG